ncbi:hypothetical protein LTR91_005561 [Friedmanniomyces endolithicus]|uniref:BTB domain-containing protein n=1 Tax=Friedmanniomyces endolithicus TaxID=329885 RepID=A0AAN6QXM6_9PEZI|nr:hypothetical protein LTR57_008212 [Friedmanniomyces endolithicus]KAK1000990.1 hypothetical protein LTR91_005561 [Friedmanniomyces endolithicus]KAK1014056.1 hypothetical protein LTS01_000586 [Friedmanniomyces endolithicus]KAK1045544.1 hypothetical protein LTS16_006527 [Friedmanniomyces endolithicus]
MGDSMQALRQELAKHSRPSAHMEDSMQAFKQGLANTYKTEEFADFTIICGPHTFRVHKVIICLHSEYFRSACRSNRFREGEKGELVLRTAQSEDDEDGACDDPEAVKHMTHFFYHLDYDAVPTEADVTNVPDSPSQVFAEPPRQLAAGHPFSNRRGRVITPHPQTTKPVIKRDGTMAMHAKVFAAAVKYQIPALQAIAASKFTAAIRTNWDHDDFAEAAHTVYTTTPDEVRGLRDEVANTLAQHGGLLDKAEVEAVVCAIDGLAYQLLKRKVQGSTINPRQVMQCGRCGISFRGEGCPNCSPPRQW